MPELPEVQTTVDHLNNAICGRTIVGAWMDPEKSVNVGSNLDWSAICKAITGHRITTVTRRAKYIVFNLETSAKLWVHQKMTGHLLVGINPSDNHGEQFIRVRWTLDDGRQIGFCDIRRFGRIILTQSDEEIPRVREIATLGPEPLELSREEFQELFTKKRGLIKPTLMNPAFIVGIGNIYADEILHRSGIHPFRPIPTLSPRNTSDMYDHMREILIAAIAAGGSSTDDYRTPDGTEGGYQRHHRAYQHTGKSCTICQRGTIERAMRNGRSSHFCSTHQL
jgi:formamidopyrimidine-DNA glycosylase